MKSLTDKLRDPETLAWKLHGLLRTICHDCPNGERDCSRCIVMSLQRHAKALAQSITEARSKLLHMENERIKRICSHS